MKAVQVVSQGKENIRLVKAASARTRKSRRHMIDPRPLRLSEAWRRASPI